MKIETRGKYPGVKVHLDAEECAILLTLDSQVGAGLALMGEMSEQVKELHGKTPGLLEERTPEQIAAILAKESEKAALQLQKLKEGKDWKKINPDKLQDALLKHVKKE